MSLEGNTYFDEYHAAKFQIIATQDDEYVCAWLDSMEPGFRVPVDSAPKGDWTLVEEVDE